MPADMQKAPLLQREHILCIGVPCVHALMHGLLLARWDSVY